MTYNILSTAQRDLTLILQVEFTYDDGVVLQREVCIYEPRSQDEVVLGINNTGVHEKKKYDMIDLINKNLQNNI